MTEQPRNSQPTAAKPAVPTISFPKQASEHALGRVLLEGRCEKGATVEILNWDNSVLGRALVEGQIWYYSRHWDTGIKHIKARQTVSGTPSDPSEECKFYVGIPRNAPGITSPVDGSTHPAGDMRFVGTCTTGATAVNVLSHDGSLLGRAKVTGTEWVYSLNLGAGVKHIKATQVVNGVEYDACGMIEFHVR